MTSNEKLKNFFANKASGMSTSHRPKKKKKQANQNNIFDIIGTVIVASSVVAVLS